MVSDAWRMAEGRAVAKVRKVATVVDVEGTVMELWNETSMKEFRSMYAAMGELLNI